MAEILVRAIDGTCPDPCVNPHRGDPVAVKPDGHTWGLCEGLPEYVVIKIPGTATDALKYLERCGLAPELRPLNPRRIRATAANIISGILAPFGIEKTPVPLGRPIVRRRRHQVPEAIVEAAEQASGSLTATLAELAAGLIDQVGD
jgi:hypothetical protein